MKSTRVLIRAKGRGLCIERGLYDCLQKELFADVTLNCDGGKIRANKGVLAAASPVLCHLLKDWPITEDAVVIMAGYTQEEVNALVRYIYTGQLSATSDQGTGWEKIIDDFKVGSPLESDDDLASIHEVMEYEDNSHSYEPDTNGLNIDHSVSYSKRSGMRGPKIVAVTSPRPLIVQVQSLTQSQGANHDNDHGHDLNDIPYEMTVEEGTEALDSDTASAYVSLKRKRTTKPAINRRIRKKPALEAHIEPSGTGVVIKKLGGKSKAKPVSKFTRKKYCCPHCNRRFLTRGNVKNHMRIHSRDKPFQCPICQDLFAYQGVYQRHLLKHRENKEIEDDELTPILAESVRRAEEITVQEHTPIRVLDDDENDEDPQEDGVEEELEEQQEPEEYPEQEEEEGAEADAEAELEEEDTELVDEEENKIAMRLQSKTNPPGKLRSSRSGVGVHFLVQDDKKGALALADGEEKGTNSIVVKRPVKGKSKDQPKHRMNYQIIECDFCPMKYHKWSAFYVHRCTHTGETPVLPCGVCEMEFPNIKALKEHKTTAHPSAVFQCDQCDRSFLSRSALLMHQPVHSTKLNFQCRYCQAKMRTLKERYVHERIHTADETPYQCSNCDKQFNTLVNLRSHLKLHATEETNAV